MSVPTIDQTDVLIKLFENTMNTLLENKKQIDLIAKELRLICEPLFTKTGISYFDYARVYYDGKSFILSTDLNYVNYFVNHEAYKNTPPPLITPGQHLWQGYIDLDFLQDVRVEFNYDNGITIIKKNLTYEEIYNFASASKNRHVLNLYLNQFDLLDRFLSFFRDKAKKLIEDAIRKPIVTINTDSFNQVSQFDHQYLDLYEFFNDNTIQPDDKPLSQNSFRFTKKESECLVHLIKGHSAKMIARDLNISYRTVEVHIDNLRKKTGSRNRVELLNKVRLKTLS